MSLTMEDLDHIFCYHAPTPDQVKQYGDIRSAGKFLAQVILQQCPDSRERSIAVTKVQEVVMWANASVALHGNGPRK